MLETKTTYLRKDGSISHEYTKRFIPSTTPYCPNCGVKDSMYEAIEGDYYQGCEYFCMECQHFGYSLEMSKYEDSRALVDRSDLIDHYQDRK